MEPIPKLKRDWKGRQVKLLRAMQTNGGHIFCPGTVMEVVDYYRGLGLMQVSACPVCKCGERRHITRVSLNHVELLPC